MPDGITISPLSGAVLVMIPVEEPGRRLTISLELPLDEVPIMIARLSRSLVQAKAGQDT